jgi:hypothetical protein
MPRLRPPHRDQRGRHAMFARRGLTARLLLSAYADTCARNPLGDTPSARVNTRLK